MSRSVRIIAVLVLILSTARSGDAQSRPSKPFQGLFGPGEAEQTRPRRMDVTWSLYDAADDNSFLATDTDILDPALQSGQWYTGATAALSYTRRPPRSVLTLNAGSAARYYPGLHEVVSVRHSGGMGLDLYPARDWRLQVANSASFSPFYQVVFGPSTAGIFAADAPPPADDYSVSKQHAMQYGSNIGLTHTYSVKSALVLNYGWHYTQVFGGAPDSSNQRAGALFTQVLTKDLGLRIGYAYGVSGSGDPTATPIRNQDIDLGVNYGRTFSPSSRTSFGFSTGSSIISSDDGRHFRVTGSGHLSRLLSPLWSAQLLYNRGLQVPDGATRPFFSDNLAVNVHGYFNDRIVLRLQPSYSHGVVGFAGLTNSYNSFTSSVRLEVALTRQLAFYGEHFYYRYQFASAVGLPGLLTTGMERQGARMGLTLWTPLVR